MKCYFHKFNTYLALAALFCAAGCASKKAGFAKKEQSNIRLYLEGNRGDVTGTGTVLVTRERFPYTIDREPFLTEADLRNATMVNEPGPNAGFTIELQFNEHGALMLDMLTTANKGRHIIVFSQFPHPGGTKPPKQNKAPKKTDDDKHEMEDLRATLPAQQPETELSGQPRVSAWLAAVQIKQRNPSGIFRFSPDSSRDETARIVRGLKNVIAYSRSIGGND